MKITNAKVNYMQVFVIINKGEIKINADVNEKNWFTEVYVTQDFFGKLVIVIANVIINLMLENIQIKKIVNLEAN